MPDDRPTNEADSSERWQLLRWLDRMLAGPLIVLSFVWLALLVLEFVVGTDTRLDLLFYSIWAVFIVEVAIELLIAPDRSAYLRSNWLKVLALLVPALRALRALSALRFLRAAGAVRSASLLRLVTTVNRGMGALSRTLDRTGFVYVIVLTVLIIVVGAAGLLFFEASGAPAAAATGITSYGEALWWTAMTMTTIGTDYSPVTVEGRVVAWLLSLYAIVVFGYVTATMASHFLGLGRDQAPEAQAGDGLRDEVAQLRSEIRRLSEQLEQSPVQPS
ncbi:MAG TPA: ion transporter [Candidatus Limnocylindria bacterium]|nr:ion transporter [Candidatus Limnocylindria bacterium]